MGVIVASGVGVEVELSPAGVLLSGACVVGAFASAVAPKVGEEAGV